MHYTAIRCFTNAVSYTHLVLYRHSGCALARAQHQRPEDASGAGRRHVPRRSVLEAPLCQKEGGREPWLSASC